MNKTPENDPEIKHSQVCDEELPSYQMPRDDLSFEEHDNPARLPFCVLSSSVRGSSMPLVCHAATEDIVVDNHGNSCSAPEVMQKNAFKSLGMTDKDISWDSSMESFVAEHTPRSQFNTIEKATLLPDPTAVHTNHRKPRALFPNESEEGLGFKPLDCSVNSEYVPPYLREPRLSDVCVVLKSLDVLNEKADDKDLAENRYDFVDCAPSSPSVFSQKFPTEETDLFDEHSSTSNVFKREHSSQKEGATPVRSPSPSIFSPDTKNNRGALPVQLLSPVPEAKTLEDSELEIVLDKSIPTGSSTPIRNISSPAPVKEEAPKEVVQVSAITSPKVPLKPRAVKKLYGTMPDVKPIHLSDDDILKNQAEIEKISCQFLNSKPSKTKTLPESKGLVPFSQLIGSRPGKKNLKRTGEKLLKFNEKKAKTDVEVRSKDITNSPKWNSPFLTSSQADITDSEMLIAADFVEKTFDLTTKETKSDQLSVPIIDNQTADCVDKKFDLPIKEAFVIDNQLKGSHTGFVGFKSANNKSISLSAASIAKASLLFDEADTNPLGLAAVNTKVPALSEAALARSKKIFEEVNEDLKLDAIQTNKIPKGGFPGFQTGNGRSTELKASSLARIRNIFDGCDVPDEDLLSTGFKTGRSSVNQPSFEQGNKSVAGKFAGFSTGSHKIIVPRKESIQKAQEVFNNETVSTTASIMEESYSALLENTDWDDSMPAAWLQTVQMTSSVQSAVKRQPSSPQEAIKRQKLDQVVSGHKLIIKKRIAAREEQARKIEEKKNTETSMKGLHYLKKMVKQKTWKEVLPDGPKSYNQTQLRDLGVVESVLNLNYKNAKDFRFSAKNYCRSFENNTRGLTFGDGFSIILDDKNEFGAKEIETAFLAGPRVAPELVPTGWVPHHYGLLVWKLGCYERSCGKLMAGSTLNPDNVMFQLKYRYDREIDRSQSSALKRILERDDAAGKALILTVLEITKLIEGYELVLSDGWYTCPARPDCTLASPIKSGKIRIGTKIMTINAELVGCEQGVPPLERPDGVYLKIFTNSTRRVRWYEKLGFRNLCSLPPIPLASVLPGGGNVACIRVAVVRVYPLIFMEKTDGGKNVLRNPRAEQKAALAFQNNLETKMSKLYHQIETDVSNKTSVSFSSAMRISEIDCPEKLCSILETSDDPGSIEASMTEAQKLLVLQYSENRRCQNNMIMERKMKEMKMNTRNVRSVLRVRLVDLSNCESTDYSAVLSLWQPEEELTEVFSEGSVLSLFNVTPGNRNTQQLYLNSTRQMRVQPLLAAHRKMVPRSVLYPSDIHSTFSPVWSELDIVGLVVQVQDIEGSSTMQTVYLTDKSQSLFGLIFWRGMKEFCCEDILAEGLIAGVSNVQWRRSSATATIPCGYITETTQFTLSSKSDQIQTAINALKDELKDEDITGVIERSQDVITARLHSVTIQPNVSLSTSNISNTYPGNVIDDLNVSTSPHPRHLNGFTQFPQAASTPVKSFSSVNWRLEQLQKTGEPPPLSPIGLPGCAKLSRPFKLPTINETSDSR